MPRMDVTEMAFAKLYPLLVAKAEKKGRTREEVDQSPPGSPAIRRRSWPAGAVRCELRRLFPERPSMNHNRTLITGKICGVRVEEIEDPLMRDIRYLDKLVDELAKGKAMEKILRKQMPDDE